ncbi:MAG: N-acetylglutamate synthase [Microbacterium sp.]|nr:N-acetylglutamate synthase [Microbacterium sp.]
MSEYIVRPARSADIVGIRNLLQPMVEQRILLGKDLAVLYGAVQEFVVAEADGVLIGCGALHVFWEDLGEVRTLLVRDDWLHHGVGRAIVDRLEENARTLGLSRRPSASRSSIPTSTPSCCAAVTRVSRSSSISRT